MVRWRQAELPIDDPTNDLHLRLHAAEQHVVEAGASADQSSPRARKSVDRSPRARATAERPSAISFSLRWGRAGCLIELG
jgi:hypothetical protein